MIKEQIKDNKLVWYSRDLRKFGNNVINKPWDFFLQHHHVTKLICQIYHLLAWTWKCKLSKITQETRLKNEEMIVKQEEGFHFTTTVKL